MKTIFGYLRTYLLNSNKKLLAASTFFAGVLVFCNYYFGLNRRIVKLDAAPQFAAWYLVFLIAFGGGYCLLALHGRLQPLRKKGRLLTLLAPALFAWKMALPLRAVYTTDVFENEYWNAVVYWPLKVLIMVGLLLAVRRCFNRAEPLYGATIKTFAPRPYLWMLLIMVPLILAAATQPDFRSMYPRFQHIAFLLRPGQTLYKLLYEVSYGIDFFSIELFFRGFLVIAFVRWAGKDAVLPMALFYCAIHFGKPMGECISSYFGGLILGIVTYHTRTIMGGLLVHVGIAWMMEVAGSLRLA